MMTDRVNGLTITLEKDVRVDDIETLKQAIRLLRGVAAVEHTEHITDMHAHHAHTQLRHELRGKIITKVVAVIDDAFVGSGR